MAGSPAALVLTKMLTARFKLSSRLYRQSTSFTICFQQRRVELTLVDADLRGEMEGGQIIVARCTGGRPLSLYKTGLASVYFLPRSVTLSPKDQRAAGHHQFLITN